MNGNGKGGGYLNHPMFYSILVIVGWGLVPTLAKAANFPGGFTTFWVNVFASLGVLAIMIWKGYLGQFKAIALYPRFIALSLIWPLAYSICYFAVISGSSGSLATLLNYLWPLFALLMLTRTMKVPPIGIALAVLGSIVVGGTMVLEGELNLNAAIVIFGLVIPLTQAFFNVTTTDERKYPGEYAWLLTFIGGVVTAIGSALFIALFENSQFTLGAGFNELLPLAIIGVGGNSIGFYAFLRAGQLSNTPESKIWFILSMFLVPFVQVLFLVLGVEKNISPLRLVGIAVVAVIFLVFKLWENRQRNAPSA